ncbi:hypothetical protein ACJ73_09095, partial [Blastomyces percursus]
LFATMAARYVSSQLIQTIQKGGKSIVVECVDKMTAWIRPAGFPTTSLRSEFVQIVEENITVTLSSLRLP